MAKMIQRCTRGGIAAISSQPFVVVFRKNLICNSTVVRRCTSYSSIVWIPRLSAIELVCCFH